MTYRNRLVLLRTMNCPTCAALRCEHRRECEIEAISVLRQRQTGAENSLQETVLKSRKRQLSIQSTLDRHWMRDHAA